MPRGGIVPKALMPLSQRAALTWNIEGFLSVTDDVIVVVSEDNEPTIRAYVDAAHPDLRVRVVIDDDPSGPGGSLLRGMYEVKAENNVILTSCDTLWHDYKHPRAAVLEFSSMSWMATAPIPLDDDGHIDLLRWCRVDEQGMIIEKSARFQDVTSAYTGLGYVCAADRAAFEDGIEGELRNGNDDVQVTAGFLNVMNFNRPVVGWLDIGDAATYKRAVKIIDGYDWAKPDEVTYVLKDSVIVKLWRDISTAGRRCAAANERGLVSRGITPQPRAHGELLTYPYAEGQSVYAAQDRGTFMDLMSWYRNVVQAPVEVDDVTRIGAVNEFYINKTHKRVAMLNSRVATALMDRIFKSSGFTDVYEGIQPGKFHGDFAFGNVLFHFAHDGASSHRVFTAIDWREDFAGHIEWGDMRYDVAKMLTSCRVHWERARYGDMRPWERGESIAEIVRRQPFWTPACEYIGALSLLNSAPLHEPPLNEILIARACEWVEYIEGEWDSWTSKPMD